MQGTYVMNTARNAEFDKLQLRPQMRDLLRAHPTPANDVVVGKRRLLSELRSRLHAPKVCLSVGEDPPPRPRACTPNRLGTDGDGCRHLMGRPGRGNTGRLLAPATILGWDFDTVAGTLHLLPIASDVFTYCLRPIRPPAGASRPSCGISFWASCAPWPRPSPASVVSSPPFRTPSVTATDSLSDFRAIADSLRDGPTRFRELIPVGPPYTRGACDACQCGMGGVGFLPDSAPVDWRAAFPLAIQRELVTSGNRTGTLSKSDLELAGTVAHKHALVQISPVTAIAERHRRPCPATGRQCHDWPSSSRPTHVSASRFVGRLLCNPHVHVAKERRTRQKDRARPQRSPDPPLHNYQSRVI